MTEMVSIDRIMVLADIKAAVLRIADECRERSQSLKALQVDDEGEALGGFVVLAEIGAGCWVGIGTVRSPPDLRIGAAEIERRIRERL